MLPLDHMPICKASSLVELFSPATWMGSSSRTSFGRNLGTRPLGPALVLQGVEASLLRVELPAHGRIWASEVDDQPWKVPELPHSVKSCYCKLLPSAASEHSIQRSYRRPSKHSRSWIHLLSSSRGSGSAQARAHACCMRGKPCRIMVASDFGAALFGRRSKCHCEATSSSSTAVSRGLSSSWWRAATPRRTIQLFRRLPARGTARRLWPLRPRARLAVCAPPFQLPDFMRIAEEASHPALGLLGNKRRRAHNQGGVEIMEGRRLLAPAHWPKLC